MTSSLKRLVKSSPLLAKFAVPLFRAQSVALAHAPLKGPVPSFSGSSRLNTQAFATKQDYDQWRADNAQLLAAQAAEDSATIPPGQSAFGCEGHCAICEAPAVFVTSLEYGSVDDDGKMHPNWREHMICRGCGLRNRVRAALHIAIQEMGLKVGQQIYMTEQFGPAYRWVKGRYGSVVGSEYLHAGAPSGSRHYGINHQDIQHLSFADASFDFLMSFDVLEHVPDTAAAFREIARVLRPGGSLLLTIPFAPDSYETIVRARMNADGSITHHLPVEMHGNPTDPINGALCFRHYGWDTLDQLRALGFRDVCVRAYHDGRLGYRGANQSLITAVRA